MDPEAEDGAVAEGDGTEGDDTEGDEEADTEGGEASASGDTENNQDNTK